MPQINILNKTNKQKKQQPVHGPDWKVIHERSEGDLKSLDVQVESFSFLFGEGFRMV